MNIRTVRELAKLMKEYDLSELELEDEQGSVRFVRAGAPAPVLPAPAQESDAPVLPPVQQAPQTPEDPGMDFANVTAVTAPMVGVFYAAAAPGQPPFVKVGSRVKKGDVLCILEAMKLMNEITAERDGQVVDICAADGDVVEFGQTLFKLY